MTGKVKEVKGSFQLTTEIYQRQVVKKRPLSSTQCEIYFRAAKALTLECEEEPGSNASLTPLHIALIFVIR